MAMRARWSPVLFVAMVGCGKKQPVIEEVVPRPCRVEIGEKTIELDYDAAGHQIGRRDRRGSDPPSVVWTFRYEGDVLVDQTLGGSLFRFERDAAGNHVATTISVAGSEKRTTIWRGEYKDGRRVASQDIRNVGFGADEREVPGTRIEYTYDTYGRVTRELGLLSIGGTVTTTYTYDDSMKCRRYRDPLRLPSVPDAAPCPTSITVVDGDGERVTRPAYRDGRLVQDDTSTYEYDASGRLERARSRRIIDGSADQVFVYECR